MSQNVAMRANIKHDTAKLKDLWPFCENPVCPDPVWRPVTRAPFAPRGVPLAEAEQTPVQPRATQPGFPR